MFGIPDVWVLLAFVLSLGSSVLCVAWGVMRWNEVDPVEEPPEELRQWRREENLVKDEL